MALSKRQTIYAFIDSQNVNLGVQELGWKLDWKRFRVYLREKYGALKVFLFIGYIPKYQKMYDALKSHGYKIIFKPVDKPHVEPVKGNVDADLVLQTMIEYQNYDKAIIVTGDGDFYCLVKYLLQQDKFARLLVPNKYKYSVLLRRVLPRGGISFMNDLRKLLAYNKHPRS